MTRVQKLISAARAAYPQDQFFQGFEESCRKHKYKRQHYRTYEDVLRLLDPQSWQVLKTKAVRHFIDHRDGQMKQGFFNQLNDAFAYRYLLQRSYTDVTILPEGKRSTPDLRYFDAGVVKHCEVKTLGISDDEIQRRRSAKTRDARLDIKLTDGFLEKVTGAINSARRQVTGHSPEGLVYLIVLWDDFTTEILGTDSGNYGCYRRQLVAYCRDRGIHDVCIKAGLRGNRRISM